MRWGCCINHHFVAWLAISFLFSLCPYVVTCLDVSFSGAITNAAAWGDALLGSMSNDAWRILPCWLWHMKETITTLELHFKHQMWWFTSKMKPKDSHIPRWNGFCIYHSDSAQAWKLFWGINCSVLALFLWNDTVLFYAMPLN